MSHEASLLNIEKMSRLGALLQLPGTTPAFKMSIQAQMEQIAKEMSEPTEAAMPLGEPPAQIGLTDISPAATPAQAPAPLLQYSAMLSTQGSARSTSSTESSAFSLVIILTSHMSACIYLTYFHHTGHAPLTMITHDHLPLDIAVTFERALTRTRNLFLVFFHSSFLH
jgi:hypothetical protein